MKVAAMSGGFPMMQWLDTPALRAA